MRQRIDKIGATGLNTDRHPHELPPQALTACSNVQTADGKLRSVTGETKLWDLAIEPKYQFSYLSPAGVQYLVVSDGTSTYTYSVTGGGAEEDISPDPWSGGRVTFAVLNSVLVVNSESDGLFFWTGPGDPLTAMSDQADWDDDWRCKQVVAYKYFLVALGMVADGAGGSESYPHKIRWSNSAEPGDIPLAWEAAADNDAGADILGETTGKIIGGAIIRDQLWIVKEDGIYAMSWVGQPAVMQTIRLSGIGTNIPQGFAELLGGMAILTTNDLILFDGTQFRSLVDSRVRNELVAMLGGQLWDRSQIFVHVPSTTLFVAACGPGYERLTQALVFNWTEDTWTKRSLQLASGLGEAIISVSEGNIWDDMHIAWDDYSGTWDYGLHRPNIPDIVVYESDAANTDWWVSVIAVVNSNSDGSPKPCFAERVALPLEGADGLAIVTEAWPEVLGTAPITIQFGSQMSPQGPVRWGESFLVTPGTDYHITPRITGRFIALRISSLDTGYWELGALTLNWERAGER